MRIAPDKWRHFYVGIGMGGFLQIITLLLFQSISHAVAVSIVTVIVISYGFELFSKITKRGHYEIMDAIASIIGGITGMAIGLVVHVFLMSGP